MQHRNESGNRKDLQCVVRRPRPWSVVCGPCKLIPMCSTSCSRFTLNGKTYSVHYFLCHYVNTVMFYLLTSVDSNDILYIVRKNCAVLTSVDSNDKNVNTVHY